MMKSVELGEVLRAQTIIDQTHLQYKDIEKIGDRITLLHQQVSPPLHYPPHFLFSETTETNFSRCLPPPPSALPPPTVDPI